MRLGESWIGWSIAAVGLIHIFVGLILFKQPLAGIANDGLWNAVDGFPGRPAAFWFMMTGGSLILVGLAVATLQKARIPVPASLSWIFAVMVAAAVIAMPLSGGWLLVPAAIGLIWKAVTRDK